MPTNSPISVYGPIFNSAYSQDGRRLPTDYDLLREYATNDIVYACVNYNANAVAQVPFRLYARTRDGQKPIRSHKSSRVSRVTKARLRANSNLVKMIGPEDDVVEITEHPLLDLLYDDNNGINGYDFFLLTQTYKEIMGRAYWRFEDAITGAPSLLYMLKPQRVMPVRSVEGAGEVIGFQYQPDLQGTWVQLPKDEVADFLSPHPEDPYGWGMSPLKAAFAQAELTTKFTRFGNELMDNRARIDGMFIPADDVGTDMARKAEEQFQQRFAGGRNGGVWFSPTKGAFVPTRYAPTDLGPMEVDRNTTARLCRAFGIPEPLMSANESTFSNMDKALQFHAKFATLPRVLQLEQRLNTLLCPLFDERLFLAADNPVPEDNEFELQKTQVAITAKVLTKNEIREECDFEPLDDPGMDELPPDEAEMQDRQNKAQADLADKKANPEPKSEADADEGEETVKAFDTARLIELNKAVANGDMPRTAAITALVKGLGVAEADAREMVGYYKGVSNGKRDAVHDEAGPLGGAGDGESGGYEAAADAGAGRGRGDADAAAGKRGADEGVQSEGGEVRRGSIVKSTGPHKSAAVQVNIYGEIAEKMLTLAHSIPKEELAEDGIELEPHITVKYGLESDNPSEAAVIVGGALPPEITFGDLTLFPATDEHAYDVLKIDVESEGLSSLHEAIKAGCANTESYPVYKPHATIAYLKAGMGEKYIGASPVSGMKMTPPNLIFSARNGSRTLLEFGKPVEKALTVASSDPITDEEKKRRKQYLLALLAFFAWQAESLTATRTADAAPLLASDAAFNAKLANVIYIGMSRKAAATVDTVAPAVNAEILKIATDLATKINITTAKQILTAGGNGDAADDVLSRAVEYRATVIEDDTEHVAEVVAETLTRDTGEHDDESPAPADTDANGNNPVTGAPVNAEIMWRTSDKENVCQICAPLNGVVVNRGEEFAPGIRWPMIDTHSGCRCRLLPLPPSTSTEKTDG